MKFLLKLFFHFLPGAFFVIDKDYFQLLGMYDPEFDIWGAENLE